MSTSEKAAFHKLQTLRCEVYQIVERLRAWRDIHGSGYTSIHDMAEFLQEAADRALVESEKESGT